MRYPQSLSSLQAKELGICPSHFTGFPQGQVAGPSKHVMWGTHSDHHGRVNTHLGCCSSLAIKCFCTWEVAQSPNPSPANTHGF